MIEIYPYNESIPANCPRCGAESKDIGELFFQGTHVLSEQNCRDCGLDFYATLPIGHAALFPVAFSRNGNHFRYNREEGSWMVRPLIESFQNESDAQAEIKLLQPNPGGDLILVNCLDSCFGHVFTKLWNVYLLKKQFPSKTLAVLVPARCRWLITDGEVEIWSVDLPLEEMGKCMLGLDAWVKEQFRRFASVALSEVPVHPPLEGLDFEEILRARPFALEDFDHQPLQVTFIWRSDRFWLNSRLLDFLHKASIKFGFQDPVRRLFCYRQASLLGQLARKLRKSLPEARLVVTGLGKEGRLHWRCQDERVEAIDEAVERTWNEIYRHSQLVLGVHGSHMLIPTALSAGFVEILPRHKVPHLTEDIGRHHRGRMGHFLGRFVDEFSSPDLVARHVVSMVKGFGRVYKGLDEEIPKSEKILGVES
ncbi:hypothetical protein [Cyclobacterium jeungdonense]|uniref:Uncharacterized protein n=1 Tax=Cyclobacterium jeungdonense TaxID=708087 RepID=A0ABT8CDI9_9BACT|nr:hypothetical protein [Cyclobacterium jeungdonense]MDN3690590.1 hypothetical protein [Cyclobacterium jeungdonense]